MDSYYLKVLDTINENATEKYVEISLNSQFYQNNKPLQNLQSSESNIMFYHQNHEIFSG